MIEPVMEALTTSVSPFDNDATVGDAPERNLGARVYP